MSNDQTRETEPSEQVRGAVATTPPETVSIAEIVRRLVRDNADFIKRLADL